MTDATTVVVVDDNDGFRAALIDLVGHSEGFACVGSAGDGDAAIALCRELAPALALVDVRMPHVDGFGLARAIAALDVGTKVVLLSAHVDPELEAEARAAGAVALIDKGDLRRSTLARVRAELAGG